MQSEELDYGLRTSKQQKCTIPFSTFGRFTPALGVEAGFTLHPS